MDRICSRSLVCWSMRIPRCTLHKCVLQLPGVRRTVKMGDEPAKSTSTVRIGATQAATERMPKDTIPLPVDRGSIEVHDDVIKGGSALALARTCKG